MPLIITVILLAAGVESGVVYHKHYGGDASSLRTKLNRIAASSTAKPSIYEKKLTAHQVEQDPTGELQDENHVLQQEQQEYVNHKQQPQDQEYVSQRHQSQDQEYDNHNQQHQDQAYIRHEQQPQDQEYGNHNQQHQDQGYIRHKQQPQDQEYDLHQQNLQDEDYQQEHILPAQQDVILKENEQYVPPSNHRFKQPLELLPLEIRPLHEYPVRLIKITRTIAIPVPVPVPIIHHILPLAPLPVKPLPHLQNFKTPFFPSPHIHYPQDVQYPNKPHHYDNPPFKDSISESTDISLELNSNNPRQRKAEVYSTYDEEPQKDTITHPMSWSKIKIIHTEKSFRKKNN